MTKGSQYNKTWRTKHPEQYKQISKNSHKKRYADPVHYKSVIDYHRDIQEKVREICINLKSISPCKDCGVIDAPYLMDFDHLEGTNNRSPQSCRSIPELKRELDKVEIVCVRCHRIRTFNRRTDVKEA